MIDVPLLQGLKEYYDYINLCNELGYVVRRYEDDLWQDHFDYLKERKQGIINDH